MHTHSHTHTQNTYTHTCSHALKSLYPLCALWPLIQHMNPLGFSSAVPSATEGPLKISPLFPNGLTLCSRREERKSRSAEKRESEGERERERVGEWERQWERLPFKMIAMPPKGLASVQGEFFREQTVECILSNEATVQLSQSLFSALLVRSGHWEHMFSLYYLRPSCSIFLCFLPLSDSHIVFLSKDYLVFSQVFCVKVIKPNIYWKCEWQVAVTFWVTLPII